MMMGASDEDQNSYDSKEDPERSNTRNATKEATIFSNGAENRDVYEIMSEEAKEGQAMAPDVVWAEPTAPKEDKQQKMSMIMNIYDEGSDAQKEQVVSSASQHGQPGKTRS